jgi:hypothetical protein
VHLVAIWGRPLGVRDAAALFEGDSAGELSTWIAEGVSADLLVSPGRQIVIRHDLIRESVYAGIPGAVRVALHRQYAEYLLTTGRGPLEAAPHMQESASVGDERAATVLADAAAESLPALPETATRNRGFRRPCGRGWPGSGRWPVSGRVEPPGPGARTGCPLPDRGAAVHDLPVDAELHRHQKQRGN